MTKAIIRVAVIGAGSSGLAQLKQLLDAFARPDAKTVLEVTVFESNSEVGGVWFSTSRPKPSVLSQRDGQVFCYAPGEDDPSAMYEGLCTNIPHDLMSFRDLPFPSDKPFPYQPEVQEYLQRYADTFNLRPHIRFNTLVTRLRHSESGGGRWEVTSVRDGVPEIEKYNYVSVSNGHYSDTWLPKIPGLASFPGQVLHSRFYRRAEDYQGKTVLVVGSFASGSDLARQIGGLNIGKFSPGGRPLTPVEPSDAGFTKVYQSSSTAPDPDAAQAEGPPRPWLPYIEAVPLITRIEPDGSIHFETRDPITDVEVIIFATGYSYSLPFCKATDEPWRSTPLLSKVIIPEEREGGRTSDVDGLKGEGVKHLDELMLFMEGDRSISFPVLQYLIVPFPLAESQARLAALLWAGFLPNFPKHPQLPPNPSNPYSTPPATPTGDSKSAPPKPIRKAIQQRQKLVFSAPYEWTYQEYLMDLMAEAGETEDKWKRIEPWRRARREDTGLRQRTLGW